MTKHTPGPWERHGYTTAFSSHNKALDVGPPGRAVACVIGEFDRADVGPEAEANARLIAEAPAMAAALRDLVSRCDGPEGVRVDGSNIQTIAAHAILARLDA